MSCLSKEKKVSSCLFVCRCGYEEHRDVHGTRNILSKAPLGTFKHWSIQTKITYLRIAQARSSRRVGPPHRCGADVAYGIHREGFRWIHRVEGDRVLLRRSFFDGDSKKLPPLYGMKVGEVHFRLMYFGGDIFAHRNDHLIHAIIYCVYDLLANRFEKKYYFSVKHTLIAFFFFLSLINEDGKRKFLHGWWFAHLYHTGNFAFLYPYVPKDLIVKYILWWRAINIFLWLISF